MAAMHEVLERRLHGLEFLELLVQLFDVSLRQRAHLSAGAHAVLPQSKQLADLLDGETQIARLSDEAL